MRITQQQVWKGVRMCMIVLTMSLILSGAGFALRPAEEQGQIYQPPQGSEEAFPEAPPGRRPERPIESSQEAGRAIVEQPYAALQPQKRYADTFLPGSVLQVTDPRDGLSKDGRMAVLEGMNSQIVYQFYSEHKVINIPNQPDLTIYTNDKGGFDGPYNVFVANFGDASWTQVGSEVKGTASFDLPASLNAAELVLIMNRSVGATYIEAVEGITVATPGGLQGTLSYLPEELIGLRAARLDYAEVERARVILTGTRQGYQLMPFGEIEVKWNFPIKNVWKQEEFFIEADGDYELYVSTSRGMESFIGRRTGNQGVDLPQDMADVANVRIRNHNTNRPVMIYSIVGRR